MIDVIYLAGGKGIRVGLGYPKQFARIGGKPIIIYGLETLNKISEIGNIIIPTSDMDRTLAVLNSYNIKNFKLVENGETRQESVYKGLKYINTEYVLICEAVRPFMSVELINRVINSVANVIPYSKLNSTPFNKYIGNVLNRDEIVSVQTPQKYMTKEFIITHEHAIERKLKDTTDDLDLVKRIGMRGDFIYIEGPEENIKITTPLDLYLAEAILKYKAGDKVE